MDLLDRIFAQMVEYFQGDPRRIQHFVKVHAFARLIGHREGLDAAVQQRLEAAAYVHDIGIKAAEEKFGSSSGKLQEQEGPAEARKLLEKTGLDPEDVERICYLVGHHHTYHDIEGVDYQILVEADFLVNLYEDHSGLHAVRAAEEKIFRTKSGTDLLRRMFGL
ncbi:MAG TPA: HD domain-containing protein [Candidatus Scatomonas pullistercoris]|uniref:HD domain-containing protein n=1 Tax=Candidatus Scatomonas pullistercoris TaxID=2840920 RepID=A0A9D1P2P9_9FIRM|nr:HD domain-containing protein [Candidatus Scatomonas pullistercoris]